MRERQNFIMTHFIGLSRGEGRFEISDRIVQYRVIQKYVHNVREFIMRNKQK